MKLRKEADVLEVWGERSKKKVWTGHLKNEQTREMYCDHWAPSRSTGYSYLYVCLCYVCMRVIFLASSLNYFKRMIGNMGFAYSVMRRKADSWSLLSSKEEGLFNDTVLVCSHMTPKAYRGVYILHSLFVLTLTCICQLMVFPLHWFGLVLALRSIWKMVAKIMMEIISWNWCNDSELGWSCTAFICLM